MTSPNSNSGNQPDPSSFRGFLQSLRDERSEFRESLQYWIDCGKQIFRDFIREQTSENLSVFTFPDMETAQRFSNEVADAINADLLCEYDATAVFPQRDRSGSTYYVPLLTVTKSGARPLTGAIVVSHNTFQPCGISVDGEVVRVAFTMPRAEQPVVAEVCSCCGQAVKNKS